MMNLTSIKNSSTVLIGILLIFLLGCSKDSINQQPSLKLSESIEGLKVTITGNAVDPDGTISELAIEWGDGGISSLTGIDFYYFTVTHIYTDPAAYEIIITANDNEGAGVVQIISVDVDFAMASLENIKPNLFKQSDKEYLILTINLHTYQESQQESKFHLIADVIGLMDVDFIAFQECAQNKSAAITQGIIREDNMALIITDIVKEKYNADYNFVWHWAHYGWTVWEEGVAILSKYPLIDSEDRYVSTSTSVGSITSRKVIYGSYLMTNGRINIFSAHTHWRTSESDEEQNNQINNIKSMVIEKELLTPEVITFVCGDFNVNPTSDYPWSEGYFTMMENGDYTDTFLEIYPDANNKPAQSQYNTIGGDFPGRIDYIFMKNNDRFEVVDSQIIFTGDVVGRVSDHNGVLTKVRDKQE